MEAFRPKTAAYGIVYSWNPETELKDQQDFVVGDTGILYLRQCSKSSVSFISREKDFFMNIPKWQRRNEHILAWCPGSGAKFLQIEPLPPSTPFLCVIWTLGQLPQLPSPCLQQLYREEQGVVNKSFPWKVWFVRQFNKCYFLLISLIITISRVPQCIPDKKPFSRRIFWSALDLSREREAADWNCFQMHPGTPWSLSESIANGPSHSTPQRHAWRSHLTSSRIPSPTSHPPPLFLGLRPLTTCNSFQLSIRESQVSWLGCVQPFYSGLVASPLPRQLSGFIGSYWFMAHMTPW